MHSNIRCYQKYVPWPLARLMASLGFRIWSWQSSSFIRSSITSGAGSSATHEQHLASTLQSATQPSFFSLALHYITLPSLLSHCWLQIRKDTTCRKSCPSNVQKFQENTVLLQWCDFLCHFWSQGRDEWHLICKESCLGNTQRFSF